MQSQPIPNASDFWSAYARTRLSHIQNTPFPQNADDLAHARQTIDNELAAMHAAIYALRTACNALSPVSRLPSETLAHVFICCAEIDPPKMATETKVPGQLGWLRVTHVCKNWCKTALHYPHVWSMIHSGLSMPWLKEVLARGGSTPVSVSLRSHITAALRSEELSEHVPRIRDFTVCVQGASNLLLIVQPMLSFPANVLRNLNLSQHHDRKTLSLPAHIFQEHAPMLRSVDLCNVYIPWSAPIFRNLTHLTVMNGGRKEGFMTGLVDDEQSPVVSPFDELLHGLRSMSALQELYLKACLPASSGPSTDQSIVELPCLKSLALDFDHAIRCSQFLNHIRIPSFCDLRLYGDDKAQMVSDVDSLFRGHVNREQALLQSLMLNIHWLCFNFSISRSSGEVATTHVFNGRSLHQLSPPEVSQTISVWCHKFPIETIQHLQVKFPFIWNRARELIRPYETSQEWINTFGRCRDVKEVELHCDRSQMLAFCTALATCVPGDTACDEMLFLPNLNRLTLDGIQFYRVNEVVHIPFEKDLLECLGARQKVKTIRTVCIGWQTRCSKENFVGKLEKIVSEVRWQKDNNWDEE